MTQPNTTRWALFAIVLLAALLRLPLLDRVPPALHPDEAALAVDARDFFSDPSLVYAHEGAGWIVGTYVWVAAPLLATPLQPEFAIRLPSALAGLLLVGAVFLLGRQLADGDPRVGLLAALMVATAPWAFHFSRLALGPCLIPLLVVGGLWAIVPKARDPAAPSKLWITGLGLALLILAEITYAPARLVVPALATLFVLTSPHRPSARRSVARLGPLWVVFALLLPWTLAGGGSEHLHDVIVLESGAGLGDNVFQVLRGYALHFSSRYLFSGSISRGFAPEGLGLFPLWQAPLLLAGLFCVARRRDRLTLCLGGWLLVHPLAAAFTADVPNAIRAGVGLPAFALIGAFGGVWLLDLARARWVKSTPRLVGALACVVLIWTGYHGWIYATRYPAEQARFYFAGRREVVEAARDALRARPGAIAFPGRFWSAYLALYAPDLPYRRDDAGWVLGAGPVRACVVYARSGDPAPAVRPGDSVLVTERALLRPVE